MPQSTAPDEKTRKSVAKATINDNNIRVAVSDPALAAKMKVNVLVSGEPIYWYIKFNILLDPSTVSRKTMTVTESDGYILETEISYDLEKNLIVIKPVDIYEEGIFYILTITRKVRSQGGNNMKRDVHILFKIKENRIEEYKLLAPNVTVAAPRKKPARLKAETAARVYGFTPEQSAKLEKTKPDMLPYDKMNINAALLLIGLFIALIGLFVRFTPMVMTGAGFLLAGAVHLLFQFRNKQKRAAVKYNMGTMYFNAGFYKAAAKRFKKATELDPTNEMAEYAYRKSAFYE